MAKKPYVKSDAPAAKVNRRQELVDAIVASLENGTSPWQRHWDAGSLAVRNGTTGKAYNGAYNILLLLEAAANKNVGDPRWATFSQASQKGWKVKAGSKTVKIYFWKRFEIKDRDSADDEDKKMGFCLKSFNVLNFSDIEGVPPLEVVARTFTPIEAGERIVAASPVEIEHVAGVVPHYSLTKDKIFMPLKEHYDAPENYYATLAHEISHSTGAIGRTDRFARGYLAGGETSGKKRAFEELVAEMSSLFIAAETGLPYEIENHAAYIQSWIGILREDPQVLFAASREAAQAADFVLLASGLRAKPVDVVTQKDGVAAESNQESSDEAHPVVEVASEKEGQAAFGFESPVAG
jgi:antirestriction protein ArdC